MAHKSGGSWEKEQKIDSQSSNGQEFGDYYGVALACPEIDALRALERVLKCPLPPLTDAEMPPDYQIREILRLHTSNYESTKDYVVPRGVFIVDGHVHKLITWRQMEEHYDFWPLDSSIGTFHHLERFNDYRLPRGFDTLPEGERFAMLEILHNLFFDEDDSNVKFFIEEGHLKDISIGWEIYLYHLPDTVSNFQMLRKLYFDMSRIQTLPYNFGQLSHLEDLTLRIHEINSFPESFGDLQSLKRLQIYQGPTPSSEMLERLMNLEELDLADTGLDSPPEAVYKLPRLKRLDLTANPLVIPPDFWSRFPSGVEIEVDPKVLINDESGFERISTRIRENRPLAKCEANHPRLAHWATRLEGICFDQIKGSPHRADSAKGMLQQLAKVSLLSSKGIHELSLWL